MYVRAELHLLCFFASHHLSWREAAYVNGVSEAVFKVGVCLPAGPYVTDDDVRYIVDCIREAIV